MQIIAHLLNIIRNFFFKTVLPFVLIAGLIIFSWSWFKKQRDNRIFTLNFLNIDGLSKGAPVYLQGLPVGKVIQTFPVVNSNAVGVKIVITDEKFSVPRNAHARIVTSIETGGGKIVELESITVDVPNEHIGWRGVPSVSFNYASHLMMDLLQMSKDFAQEGMKMLAQSDPSHYKNNLENSVKNAITSLEYGTLQSDIKNEINQLNRKIREAERDPARDYKVNQAMRNQMKALEKTISSLANVSDVYKDQNRAGIYHVKEKTYNKLDSKDALIQR